MNELLPARFIERIQRLFLGLEPVDAQRAERIAHAIEIALDGIPRRAGALARGVRDWDRLLGFPDAIGGLTRIPRHDSCRHALLYRPGLETPVVIRLFDRRRRFAPRRLSYPVPADIRTPLPRVRRPALYPGAAYDVGHTATGMRGRVTWNQADTDEVPVRWVRVEARVDGQVVGRAHGDDRGEFLLLLESSAVGLKDLSLPVIAEVVVFGPPAPVPLPLDDPLGDLPIETLLADPDDVSPGKKLPPGYVSTPHSHRLVTFRLGVLLRNQDKFFFNP